MRHFRWILLLLLFVRGQGVGTAQGGVTIVVNSLADKVLNDGYCTLREAVEAANMNTAVDTCSAGSFLQRDTVIFGVDGTFFLDSELVLSGGVTIQGNGQDKTILDGQRDTYVLELSAGGRGGVEIYDLTIQNGVGIHEDAPSGGIYAKDHGHSLLVDGVVMQANEGIFGGGIFFSADGESLKLIIRNSIFMNNVVSYAQNNDPWGGAVFWSSSCSICADHGFIIENSIFQDNTADFGGAVYAKGSSLIVSNSTFSANQAGLGAAIASRVEELTILNSTISDNVGDAIYQFVPPATLKAQVNLGSSTIVNNKPTNLSAMNGEEITVVTTNTIFANNGSQNCSLPHPIISLGFNMTDNNDCGFDENKDVITTPTIVQQTLGLLRDNGGLTPTRALLPGSPAIDAGSCSPEVPDDQRGVFRPQGSSCDIGAFEYKSDFYKLFLPLVLK